VNWVKIRLIHHARGVSCAPGGKSKGAGPERRSSVVTLLFTDVVGSTALKQQLGDRAGVALVSSTTR
jgi:class 3 adenylate cyclase